MNRADLRPLIAHVVYRFDVGGLENGVVNLINRLPAARFRHAVVALTEVTDFRDRILRDDVEFIALHKAPGPGLRLLPALRRTFATLKPDLVHTRNLAPLEASLPAWLAGVRARIHGEHGWDVGDLGGGNWKHRLVRRAYRPFVTHYVALSAHIEAYLRNEIGVPAARIRRICNGVDSLQFHPAGGGRAAIEGSPFNEASHFVVGTVGRLAAVKDQATLIRALALARQSAPDASRLRLAIVGAGPLRGELTELARKHGVAHQVWFSGARHDIAAVLRGLDLFALPSLAEGISNTVLEAMATGLPVVATAAGGTPELVNDGVSGTLVQPADEAALAAAMLNYLHDPELRRAHGQAARLAVETRFSLDRMVADYAALYESALAAQRAPSRLQASGSGSGH